MSSDHDEDAPHSDLGSVRASGFCLADDHDRVMALRELDDVDCWNVA